MKNNCHCGGELKYFSDLAAPGIGQVWKCENCFEVYHKRHRFFILVSEIDPEDLELSEYDVM